MRLTPRVHLVGSGATGADLSNPYDCHVYLVDGGGPLALIDAGVGLEPELILANVRAAGFDPAAIETIALTHAHADHGGGAGPLHELTGAEVLAPWTRRNLAQTGRRGSHLAPARPGRRHLSVGLPAGSLSVSDLNCGRRLDPGRRSAADRHRHPRSCPRASLLPARR